MPPADAPLRDWIVFASGRLAKTRLVFGHGTHNAHDEAAWLLVHVLRLPFERLDASLDQRLPAVERRRVLRLLDKRIESRKPLAYLLHEAWLKDRRFYVDERAIVPRSFIAELLPEALQPWVGNGARAKHVLDMCTGSGCLAIIAAQTYPNSVVTGADISKAALAVARRNVLLYRLSRRVRLVHSDLFSAVQPDAFDLILSNPPYVAAAAMRRLPAEYRHEPALALAGGRDGLDAVDVLLRDAARHLKPGGVLVAEIGHNRKALERKYPDLPFTWLTTSAGDDRVFALTREQLARRRNSKLPGAA